MGKAITAWDWAGLLLICFVLPAVLSTLFCQVLRPQGLDWGKGSETFLNIRQGAGPLDRRLFFVVRKKRDRPLPRPVLKKEKNRTSCRSLSNGTHPLQVDALQYDRQGALVFFLLCWKASSQKSALVRLRVPTVPKRHCFLRPYSTTFRTAFARGRLVQCAVKYLYKIMQFIQCRRSASPGPGYRCAGRGRSGRPRPSSRSRPVPGGLPGRSGSADSCPALR